MHTLAPNDEDLRNLCVLCGLRGGLEGVGVLSSLTRGTDV